MSLKSYVMPWVARTLVSRPVRGLRPTVAELKRRLRSAPHEVICFYRVDDPYSHLLVQALSELTARFDIQPQLRVVRDLPEEMYPEPDMLARLARKECPALAALYELDFPAHAGPPDDTLIEAAERILLNQGEAADWLQTAINVGSAVWSGDAEALKDIAAARGQMDAESASRKRAGHETELDRRGHYMSGMLYYGGNWYWGIDRLDHLERRLLELGVARESGTGVRYNRSYINEGRMVPGERLQGWTPRHALEFFYSIRSPYSFLALERVFRLADHYRVQVVVKPVLPMVMRGLAVPARKKFYIFFDTKREADKLGIPYGFLADPVGAGTERCYALFGYARELGKVREYLTTYARAVYTQGIPSDTNRGLKKITDRVGMDWDKVKSLLPKEDWRDWAEANRREMISLGSWGVPTLKYGDLVVWGQDRLWMIEHALAQECENEI